MKTKGDIPAGYDDFDVRKFLMDALRDLPFLPKNEMARQRMLGMIAETSAHLLEGKVIHLIYDVSDAKIDNGVYSIQMSEAVFLNRNEMLYLQSEPER